MTSSARPHLVDLRALLPLDLKEAVGAVQRDTTVIADDAAAAVGVRESGDDARLAAPHDFRRVGVEDAVVVGLAPMREGLMHGRVGGEAGSRQPGLHHAQPAGGEDRALEGLVGLQANNHLVLTVDIAGRVGEHAGGRRRIHVEHALLLLLLEIGLQLRPHRLRARRRAGQEGLVAAVGRDVAHDEVAHVDRAAPAAGLEAAPAMPASLSGRGQVDAFHCVPPVAPMPITLLLGRRVGVSRSVPKAARPGPHSSVVGRLTVESYVRGAIELEGKDYRFSTNLLRRRRRAAPDPRSRFAAQGPLRLYRTRIPGQ